MTGGKFPVEKDTVELGVHIARECARLDIGQGCVVRKGTVLAVEAFEGKYILAAMAANKNNVTQASRALGVHRNTLHNKLRTKSMLNGFAEAVRPSRRRVPAKRAAAPAVRPGRTQRSGR